MCDIPLSSQQSGQNQLILVDISSRHQVLRPLAGRSVSEVPLFETVQSVGARIESKLILTTRKRLILEVFVCEHVGHIRSGYLLRSVFYNVTKMFQHIV